MAHNKPTKPFRELSEWFSSHLDLAELAGLDDDKLRIAYCEALGAATSAKFNIRSSVAIAPNVGLRLVSLFAGPATPPAAPVATTPRPALRPAGPSSRRHAAGSA